MAIGTSFAISRLRKNDIFCISPTRVNIGGKVNIVCFDKTGTLTEEGLDVLGVRSVVRSQNVFTELHRDPDDVPIFGAADAKTPLLHALATCHALKVVNGEVIGDPLDLRMFEFTGWTLEEGKEGVGRPSTEESRKKPGPGASSKVPDRAATLVQTVVRPPGGESFKLEDALKAGSKVRFFFSQSLRVKLIVRSQTARSFPRTRSPSYFRLCLFSSSHERPCQEAQVYIR
jgi:cation-transporting ATPase 13A2